MIQVPLHSSWTKIGHSGRIDWFQTGKFVEFQESYWDNTKFDLKQKVEFEIFQLKQGMALSRFVKKTRIASLIVVFALFAYLMVLLLTVNTNSADQDDVDNIIVSYVIFFVVVMICLVFQIAIVRKMLHMVRLGVCSLNEKLHREGFNVRIDLQPETFLRRCCGSELKRYAFVDVYEYTTY